MYDEIKRETEAAVTELLELAALRPGSLVVVGCSSSEIMGARIGKGSTPEAAEAVYGVIAELLDKQGLLLAAQCCEHLNRALVVEKRVARAWGLERVCVVPQPKAGGSLATAAWRQLEEPVAVEAVRADAGLDIGGTLIGMHLRPVAVPVRLERDRVGDAAVLAARTRPRLIGGERARYA